jgi:cell division septal protein FtsQ
MKKIYLLSLILVLLVSLSLLVYASNSWSGEQPVEKIVVKGNQILKESEIFSLPDSLILSNIDANKMIEIETNILRNKYVEDVTVYKNSNRLIIEITEKSPVAYYISNKGDVKFVSKDLTILNVRKDLDNYNLPVLRLKNGSIDTSNTSLKDFIKILDQYDNIDLLLSEIVYDVKTKEFDLVLNQNSIVVKLGRKRNFEDKFKKFDQFWFNVALKEGLNFKTVDLRWDKKILVS